STFTNSLLSQERMIVSNIPGTTTDAVNNLFQYNESFYRIIDTSKSMFQGGSFLIRRWEN
ncbi:MAG: GTPase, partial ['Waltheria sp.' little leaf phytoplasma]|nr:GTPase ['Waltheria sp.' little leaf phytoplasma]